MPEKHHIVTTVNQGRSYLFSFIQVSMFPKYSKWWIYSSPDFLNELEKCTQTTVSWLKWKDFTLNSWMGICNKFIALYFFKKNSMTECSTYINLHNLSKLVSKCLLLVKTQTPINVNSFLSAPIKKKILVHIYANKRASNELRGSWCTLNLNFQVLKDVVSIDGGKITIYQKLLSFSKMIKMKSLDTLSNGPRRYLPSSAK